MELANISRLCSHCVPAIGFYSLANSAGELERAFLFTASLTEGHVTAASVKVLTVRSTTDDGSGSVSAWLEARCYEAWLEQAECELTAGAALGKEQEDCSSMSVMGGQGTCYDDLSQI